MHMNEAVKACRHVLSTSGLWADQAAFEDPLKVPYYVMYGLRSIFRIKHLNRAGALEQTVANQSR